jgi:site-specific recombinase XerD
LTSPDTDFATLLQGYQLCAASEGKSPRAIDAVRDAVRYFKRFLDAQHIAVRPVEVSAMHIRAFISDLQHRPRYATHPLVQPKQQTLSSHSVNCYARGLRVFFSWLTREEIIPANPFAKVQIPRPTRKIIATFSEEQLGRLLSVINTQTPVGQRDYTIILLLLDSGLRVSELCGLKMEDVRLDEGLVKVLGKGNKERLIPIGRLVQKLMWHYIGRFRPAPAMPRVTNLFLTDEGYPLSKDRVGNLVKDYGLKAGLTGVRCSPHTFRHTAAVTFLRSGGDVFSLQRLLGHSSLEMTRRYCQLADIDVQRAHMRASPVDNLGIREHFGKRNSYSSEYSLHKEQRPLK